MNPQTQRICCGFAGWVSALSAKCQSEMCVWGASWPALVGVSFGSAELLPLGVSWRAWCVRLVVVTTAGCDASAGQCSPPLPQHCQDGTQCLIFIIFVLSLCIQHLKFVIGLMYSSWTKVGQHYKRLTSKFAASVQKCLRTFVDRKVASSYLIFFFYIGNQVTSIEKYSHYTLVGFRIIRISCVFPLRMSSSRI